MVTCSSILAWEIPWTEKPGRLQPHEVTKSQTQRSDNTYTVLGMLTHCACVITPLCLTLRDLMRL